MRAARARVTHSLRHSVSHISQLEFVIKEKKESSNAKKSLLDDPGTNDEEKRASSSQIGREQTYSSYK